MLIYMEGTLYVGLCRWYIVWWLIHTEDCGMICLEGVSYDDLGRQGNVIFYIDGIRYLMN